MLRFTAQHNQEVVATHSLSNPSRWESVLNNTFIQPYAGEVIKLERWQFLQIIVNISAESQKLLGMIGHKMGNLHTLVHAKRHPAYVNIRVGEIDDPMVDLMELNAVLGLLYSAAKGSDVVTLTNATT